MSVYLCLSLRGDISRTTRAIFTNFLCMLPTVVARSSPGEGGEVCYLRLPCFKLGCVNNCLFFIFDVCRSGSDKLQLDGCIIILCKMPTIQYSARSARLSVHKLFTFCIRRGLVSRDSIVDGDWLPATE